MDDPRIGSPTSPGTKISAPVFSYFVIQYGNLIRKRGSWMLIPEIAKEYGYTLKQLATEADIPYTTLASMKSREIKDWKPDYVQKISLVLHTDLNILGARTALSPFIKWAGGKRQLLHNLRALAPRQYNTYFEPFVGGGALFLSLQPTHGVINDWNTELTNVWKMVKTRPQQLIGLLEEHRDANSKEYYLNLRAADRDGRLLKMTEVERAARFIFLNKTGFNGLWRVNSKGQNNVPYGRYSHPTIISDSLLAVSRYMRKEKIKILSGDYSDAVASASKNDFVYFDPPYVPISPTASFTSYTQNGFGLIQQEQLRDLACELHAKGVFVMLSNSDTPIVRDLYADSVFTIHEVQASRAINSKGNGRGKVGELIITTY